MMRIYACMRAFKARKQSTSLSGSNESVEFNNELMLDVCLISKINKSLRIVPSRAQQLRSCSDNPRSLHFTKHYMTSLVIFK